MDYLRIWQALPGGCSIHGDPEMEKNAANQLFSVAPESPVPYIYIYILIHKVPYVLLANLYSFEGK